MDRLSDIQVAKLLGRTPLLGGAPESQLVTLARTARHRRLEAEEVLYLANATGTPICCIAEGRMRITSTGRNGNELLLRMYEVGEIFGEVTLADDSPRTTNATADRKTYLVEIARSDLLPVMERNPDCAMAFSRILSEYLREAVANLEHVGLHDAKKRLWIRLMYLALRYGAVDSKTGHLRIKHEFSQQNLADSIGLTRVMVNRQLNVWRKLGLIEYGRGLVEVRNPDALESYVWRESGSETAPPTSVPDRT